MTYRRIAQRFIAACLLALLASGCLVRVAYNNADWLMLWEIDRYFDLTSEQSDFVQERLREHLRWHRDGELDKTIAFLQRVQQRAADGVTDAELGQTFTEFDALRGALAVRFAADSATLFARIDDEQIRHLERALAETNEEWEERAALPQEERMKDRTKRILRMVRNWVGTLDEKQQEELARESERLPDMFAPWLAYMKERQHQFINLVRTARTDPDIVRIAFPAWTMAPAPPPFNTQRDAVRNFILEVDRRCTAEQRRHFVEKVQDWIDDLQQARV